jgi:hypothetical protein
MKLRQQQELPKLKGQLKHKELLGGTESIAPGA